MIQSIPETGSTNADLLQRLNGGEAIPDGYWLVADRQTQGRGRQGRSWLDAPGNFMGSTVVPLNPPHDPPPATLSFVAALAVYETVLPLVENPQALMLKWPNDVLLAGAKFCGLLLERGADSVVVGIGVNLASAPEVPGRLVGALGGTRQVPPRDAFARSLAEQFARELQRWREFGHEPILSRWLAAAHPVGTPLSVHQSDGSAISGSFAGLAEEGALHLRLQDGTVRVIHAGDVMLENS